jgi:hypothetical protein
MVRIRGISHSVLVSEGRMDVSDIDFRHRPVSSDRNQRRVCHVQRTLHPRVFSPDSNLSFSAGILRRLFPGASSSFLLSLKLDPVSH